MSDTVDMAPAKLTRQEIALNAQKQRAAENDGDEAVSPINERMAEVMRLEAAGEDVPEEMLSMDIDEEEAAAQAAYEELEEEPEKTDDEPEEFVTVTVNGQEQSVPKWEVDADGGVEAYQKRRAATQKLQDAVERSNAILTESAELAQHHPSPRPGEAGPSSDALTEADTDKLIDDAVDKLYEGDTEAAKEALRQAMNKTVAPEEPAPASPTYSKPPALAQAEQELHDEHDAQIAAANQLARDEFSDILDDDALNEIMFDRFRVEYSKPENAGRTIPALVRESGMWLRNKLGQQVILADPQVEKQVAAKKVRKRRMPAETTATGKRGSGTPPPQKPLSGSQVVARMRKSFGQG